MSENLFNEVMSLKSVQDEGKQTLNEISKLLSTIKKVISKLQIKVKKQEAAENE